MHFLPTSILSILIASLVPLACANYFVISEPGTGLPWANGQTNVITWEKGLEDGVEYFDIELERVSVDGLSFIARDIPTSYSSLNVYIDGLQTGDDYVIIFTNTTPGILFTTSSTFAITNSTNSSSPSPVAGSPTVSIIGAPNPTAAWPTTFPPTANGALGWRAVEGSLAQIAGVSLALAMCIFAGTLVL